MQGKDKDEDAREVVLYELKIDEDDLEDTEDVC